MIDVNKTNKNKEELFEFKLSLLKKELEVIDKIIERHDRFTQTTKNWAVIVWLGAISIIIKELPNNEFEKILFIIPVIPFIFWIVDATWRRLQNRSIYRGNQIAAFINSKTFEQAFEQKDLNSFYIWDVVGRKHAKEDKFIKQISFFRIFVFNSVARLYIGMIILTLFLAFFIKFV